MCANERTNERTTHVNILKTHVCVCVYVILCALFDFVCNYAKNNQIGRFAKCRYLCLWLLLLLMLLKD